MSYKNIYSVIKFLFDHGYLKFDDTYGLPHQKQIYMLCDLVIENLDVVVSNTINRDDYALDVLRDIRRLLYLLDE